MASVRFICGTQTVHKQLERRSATSWAPRTPSSTAAASTPTAASSRPPRPRRRRHQRRAQPRLDHRRHPPLQGRAHRYANGDIHDLEAKLKEADGRPRTPIIATDGVFSMDGRLAKLDEICDLADEYDAWS
jgi:glycine C-acetyltransferase